MRQTVDESNTASRARSAFRRRVLLTLVFLFTLLSLFGVVSVVRAVAQEPARQVAPVPPEPVMSAERASVMRFGLMAAAIAFGFGAIGAGIAIANVGAAAMGAIGEKPEIGSQALIFIALAEGLVVFGFITALMILGRI